MAEAEAESAAAAKAKAAAEAEAAATERAATAGAAAAGGPPLNTPQPVGGGDARPTLGATKKIGLGGVKKRTALGKAAFEVEEANPNPNPTP